MWLTKAWGFGRADGAWEVQRLQSWPKITGQVASDLVWLQAQVRGASLWSQSQTPRLRAGGKGQELRAHSESHWMPLVSAGSRSRVGVWWREAETSCFMAGIMTSQVGAYFWSCHLKSAEAIPSALKDLLARFPSSPIALTWRSPALGVTSFASFSWVISISYQIFLHRRVQLPSTQHT